MCHMTKRDEAGAQITMATQYGEAMAAASPARITCCLNTNAKRASWTVAGKDVLSWTEPSPCV